MGRRKQVKGFRIGVEMGRKLRGLGLELRWAGLVGVNEGVDWMMDEAAFGGV